MRRMRYILPALLGIFVALTASSEVLSGESVLRRLAPAAETFTVRMSFGSNGRYFGMAAVSLGSAKDVTLNNSCPEKVKLYYEGNLLTEIGTTQTDYTGIMNMGIQFLNDNDGLLEYETGNNWVFMFNAMAPAIYRQPGEYVMEIPEGLFVKGKDTIGALSLRYNLVSKLPDSTEPPHPDDPQVDDPTPKIPFTHAFIPGSPSREDFSLSTSYRAEYGTPYAMAAIALSCPKGVKLVKDCKEKVQLYNSEKLLGEIGTDDDGTKGIYDIGISLFEDDGLIDFGNGMTKYLFMFDSSIGEQFRQPGRYTFKMPEGLFQYEDAVIEAGEMYFNYAGDVTPEFTYSISPEEGSIFTVDAPIQSVTLRIDGFVNLLDYAGTPGALYGPDGKVLVFESRYATINGNEITWNFKENKKYPITWIPGEYTFRLPRRSININTWSDYVDGTFPEQELTVKYLLTSDLTGISSAVDDLEESYTVFSTDGTLLYKDAGSDILGLLPPGLYIVNGRKVLVTHD